MTKKELIELLQKVNVPYKEGILTDDDVDISEHIVFWDFEWSPISSSGKVYTFNVTYQISFISDVPRSENLIKLVVELLKNDKKVEVFHEYIAKNRQWHSYFSLEVNEDICLTDFQN